MEVQIDMDTIDTLNSQYVRVNKIIEDLKMPEYAQSEELDMEFSEVEYIKRSLNHLSSIFSNTGGLDFRFVKDTIEIGNCFIECYDDIQLHKKLLLAGNAAELSKISHTIVVKQSALSMLQKMYRVKYNQSIDSLDTLSASITKCLNPETNGIEENLNIIKSKAKNILSETNILRLGINDSIEKTDELPDKITIATMVDHEYEKLPLLRELKIAKKYKSIVANLRNQGNIIIRTDLNSISADELDNFVMAYIFRYIQAFPLGAVNVHIFGGKENEIYYEKLYNNFRAETNVEATKKVIQRYSDLHDISHFSKSFCNDIINKMRGKSDLFSIHDEDPSDPFNLIILRDGFVDSNGYVYNEMLEELKSLTKPGQKGHRCGIRFLIIDQGKSLEHNMSDVAKRNVDLIIKNCECVLEYDAGEFKIDDQMVDVLTIIDDLEEYVDKKSIQLAEAINQKEKATVSLEDVYAKTVSDRADSIMYIPVGKSGAKVVEIPLSCKNEKGTAAGLCIGYMVIGRTGLGKSSFFHSVVLNGCKKYSPRDLQFWLLDFKNGTASSQYKNSGIPHIRIISENNKIDDALCLFQMVLEEMKRRTEAFKKLKTYDIIDYNNEADKRGLEHFPRIIILIDEIQEIFLEDNPSEIKNQIFSISSRMRSSGIHFIMVAQNLSGGKSFMLKESFLPNATGRVCFGVAEDVLKDSGFGNEFYERKREISELKSGEAYISYGDETIKKVKIAYVTADEMQDKYFDEICSQYPDFSDMNPLLIGSKERLSVVSELQGTTGNYWNEIQKITSQGRRYSAIIGEDVYRMTPLTVTFSQNKNSALLLMGSDNSIASSICTSIVLSLMRQNVTMHLFNGDRFNDDDKNLVNPFMCVCQKMSDSYEEIQRHVLKEFSTVLRDLYSEYLKRQEEMQNADKENPVFSPIFLIVNDLSSIKSFNLDEMIESKIESTEEITENSMKTGVFTKNNMRFPKGNGLFRENVKTILSILIKNGYRYNLHVVLAIKSDITSWRGLQPDSDGVNVILFNNTSYTGHMRNSYYVNKMLNNISNGDDKETLAVVASGNGNYSKIRPIIYDMSIPKEALTLQLLLRRG